MKSCLECGAVSAEDAAECEQCGFEFAQTGELSQREAEQPLPAKTEALNRPTGVAPMRIGYLFLVVAGILFLMSATQEGLKSYEVDYIRAIENNPYRGTQYTDLLTKQAAAAGRSFMLQVGAGAAFSMFLLLWSVGYIVKAISFLPGKHEA